MAQNKQHFIPKFLLSNFNSNLNWYIKDKTEIKLKGQNRNIENIAWEWNNYDLPNFFIDWFNNIPKIIPNKTKIEVNKKLIENIFSKLESDWSVTLKNLIESIKKSKINNINYYNFFEFLLFQYNRTPNKIFQIKTLLKTILNQEKEKYKEFPKIKNAIAKLENNIDNELNQENGLTVLFLMFTNMLSLDWKTKKMKIFESHFIYFLTPKTDDKFIINDKGLIHLGLFNNKLGNPCSNCILGLETNNCLLIFPISKEYSILMSKTPLLNHEDLDLIKLDKKGMNFLNSITIVTSNKHIYSIQEEEYIKDLYNNLKLKKKIKEHKTYRKFLDNEKNILYSKKYFVSIQSLNGEANLKFDTKINNECSGQKCNFYNKFYNSDWEDDSHILENISNLKLKILNFLNDYIKIASENISVKNKTEKLHKMILQIFNDMQLD